VEFGQHGVTKTSTEKKNAWDNWILSNYFSKVAYNFYSFKPSAPYEKTIDEVDKRGLNAEVESIERALKEMCLHSPIDETKGNIIMAHCRMLQWKKMHPESTAWNDI
jgi:hypothetical protein